MVWCAHSPRSPRWLNRIASGSHVGGVKESRAPPSTAPWFEATASPARTPRCAASWQASRPLEDGFNRPEYEGGPHRAAGQQDDGPPYNRPRGDRVRRRTGADIEARTASRPGQANHQGREPMKTTPHPVRGCSAKSINRRLRRYLPKRTMQTRWRCGARQRDGQERICQRTRRYGTTGSEGTAGRRARSESRPNRSKSSATTDGPTSKQDERSREGAKPSQRRMPSRHTPAHVKPLDAAGSSMMHERQR